MPLELSKWRLREPLACLTSQDLCSPWMAIWGMTRERGEEGAKGTNRTDLTKNTLSRSGHPCQRAPKLPPEAPGKL